MAHVRVMSWHTISMTPSPPESLLPSAGGLPADVPLQALPQLKGAAPLCTLSLEAAHIQWWVDGGWEVISLASFSPLGVSSEDHPSSSAARHVGQGLCSNCLAVQRLPLLSLASQAP